MDPIVFIHGYSAESEETTKSAISKVYGSLPEGLRRSYGADNVVEIFLSRYISLEDGVTVDDVSGALDRVLREKQASLLDGRFHVVAHSIGALVIRNWIRRFSPKPSPVQNLVHLAGSNFGSGWGHIGRGQLAKWGRHVFQGGAERGVRILEALELGSSWTLDLHLHFLRKGTEMLNDYKVREYAVIGTQADASWFEIPIRYSHEDGSDGVVRAAAGNLNFNYLRLAPTEAARALPWRRVRQEYRKGVRRTGRRGCWYEPKLASHPGVDGRPVVPLAIPYACAHTGEEMGIVTGTEPRDQVVSLLKLALETQPQEYSGRVAAFEQQTKATYDTARAEQAPSWWYAWMSEPRSQYDRHAQVIFRLRDQDGRPVDHYDIFFDSNPGRSRTSVPIGRLFETDHKNRVSPNIITFYLRTDAWIDKEKDWVPRIPKVDGCTLEIVGSEPETDDVCYLPLRFELDAATLGRWVEADRTTVIDVELLRTPSDNVFRLV